MSEQQQPSRDFRICAKEIHGEVFTEQRGETVLLHSCVIQGKPSVVHPRNLAKTAPQLYHRLKTFAQKHQLNLVAERRTKSSKVLNEKRRPWLPILLLSISANYAAAENPPPQTWQKTLNLTGEKQYQLLHQQRETRANNPNELNPRYHNFSDQLHEILQQHFQPDVNDPHNISEEIALIASYYARFPEVVQLFSDIETLPWDLKFEKRTFRTDVTGNALTIKNTTVYFDPHVAARLKFQSSCREKVPYCVASPADALLHELLHVKSILLNTREYIANGGMGGLLYPFKHERQTISQENDLYRAMTAVDGQPRPIRNEHTGRYLLVACSTCIE